MKKLLMAACTLFLCVSTVSAQGMSSYDIEGLTAREVSKISRTESRRSRAKKTKLSDVCTKVSNINGLLIKITAGGHIPKSDPRYSGFSIVCAGKCVSFPAKVYHCDGSDAFRMGYYGKWVGNGKSRGYCGSGAPSCPTSAVRARSRALKCGGAGYLATGGKSCMRFNLNVDRNGGV